MATWTPAAPPRSPTEPRLKGPSAGPARPRADSAFGNIFGVRRPVAILVSVLAVAAGGVSASAQTAAVIGDDPLSVLFRFDLTPSTLPRAKPAPARLSISGNNEMNDGSHVPAL